MGDGGDEGNGDSVGDDDGVEGGGALGASCRRLIIPFGFECKP